MDKGSDYTIVTCSIRLQDLKHWEMNGKETIPFYLHAGDSGGLVLNDKPEIACQLIRIYNTQKISF
jgi:hypothetical protein